MAGAFVDWMTVSQCHADGGFPACEIEGTVDLSTGQLRRKPWMVEGKLGSKVRVFSDGVRVQFDGNPSRFDRAESVEGLSVEAAKRRVNGILGSLGLPSFSSGQVVSLRSAGGADQLYTGAVVSRLDLTRNFVAMDGIGEFLSFVGQSRYGRLERTVIGRNVYFGKGSRKRLLRVYDKAAELATRLSEYSGSDRAYLEAMCFDLESHGVVRAELSLRADLARMLGSFWHELGQDVADRVYETEVSFMTNAKRLDLSEFDGIPTRFLGILMLHLSGVDVKARMLGDGSRAAFYAARKALLKTGYDISQPVATPMIPKRVEIHLASYTPPVWYRAAAE